MTTSSAVGLGRRGDICFSFHIYSKMYIHVCDDYAYFNVRSKISSIICTDLVFSIFNKVVSKIIKHSR